MDTAKVQVLRLASFTKQSPDISSFGDSWLDKLGAFVIFRQPTSIFSIIVVLLDYFFIDYHFTTRLQNDTGTMP